MIKKITPAILIYCICIISRLPQLLSPHLFIDSDESVIGLMTKHLVENGELSIFFWGQQYGFSLIEEVFIAPFMMLFGVKVLSLKAGMLLLWSTGVVFFHYTLVAIGKGDRKLPWLITIMLIAAPGWAIWSMKARGGYLTAFTLSSIATYLLFDERYKKRLVVYAMLGVLCYFIYESQLFFLSGLLPLVAYQYMKERTLGKTVAFIFPILALGLAFSKYKEHLHIYYRVPKVAVTWENLYEKINRIPDFLYNSMHGTYHFQWKYPPDFFAAIFALIISGYICMLLIGGISHLLKGRNRNWLYIASTAFVPLTFLYTLPAESVQFRYMLPVIAYALLALFIYLSGRLTNKTLYTQLVIIIMIGFAGSYSFSKSQYQRVQPQVLFKAIDYLQQNDIKFVYCADYTFAWDIMFHSNEAILARNFHFPGRYPKYDTLIDKAYFNGEKTAVFGTSYDRFGLQFEHYQIDSFYYISENPPLDRMTSMFSFMPR